MSIALEAKGNPVGLEVPKLRVAGLTKRFAQKGRADLVVFQDLSFDVAKLEFLAVIGPSGCGKSTVLRIIDGLERADGGAIHIDGREVTEPGAGRAMVFQDFRLFPWRTAIDNIALGLEIGGVPKAERKVVAKHYVDLVGLTGFENTYPHQLSGGMQQRVGIARALAVRPEILLMDEPFGALDIQTRDLLQEELLSIWSREKKTVIFVTHSIEEAIFLADRIIVLSPRPSCVQMDIRIPLSRPRTEDVKAKPEFVAIRQEIWHTLKKGVVI